MRPPGLFYPGVPAEEYHADPACSSTGLRHLLRSPAHFRAYLDTPSQDTPALALGRAVHSRLLEPETFGERYAVAPKVDRRTKDGKAAWEAFVTANPGREYLTEEDAVRIEGMAASVAAHPIASRLLVGGAPELSAYWIDAETGTPCRARFDYLREGDAIGIDAKTTTDADPSVLARAIIGWGLHVQAAHYAAGFEVITGRPLDHFLFCFVEKAPPFAVTVARLDDTALAEGRRKVREALARYAECERSGRWPGYSEEIVSVGLPPWALPLDLEDDQ